MYLVCLSTENDKYEIGEVESLNDLGTLNLETWVENWKEENPDEEIYSIEIIGDETDMGTKMKLKSKIKVGSRVVTGNAINYENELDVFVVTGIENGIITGWMSNALCIKEGYDPEEGYRVQWDQETLLEYGFDKEEGRCWMITDVLDD